MTEVITKFNLLSLLYLFCMCAMARNLVHIQINYINFNI